MAKFKHSIVSIYDENEVSLKSSIAGELRIDRAASSAKRVEHGK